MKNNKFNILLVDRNKRLRQFLQRELIRDGYDVEGLSNTKELLLRKCSNIPVDLIIIDIDLPVISGLRALEQLLFTYPPVPILVYTLLDEYMKHPLVISADAAINKSEDITELKRIIYDILQNNNFTSINLQAKV